MRLDCGCGHFNQYNHLYSYRYIFIYAHIGATIVQTTILLFEINNRKTQ